EPKVDDREKVLAFGVARLELQRLFELVFGLVDAVVLEELAAAVEMKEEVFRRLRFRHPVTRVRRSPSVVGAALHGWGGQVSTALSKTRRFLKSCYPSAVSRTAKVTRKTRETDITVELDLDGSGKADVSTPLPFLSHMVEQIARHGLIDLQVKAEG